MLHRPFQSTQIRILTGLLWFAVFCCPVQAQQGWDPFSNVETETVHDLPCGYSFEFMCDTYDTEVFHPEVGGPQEISLKQAQADLDHQVARVVSLLSQQGFQETDNATCMNLLLEFHDDAERQNLNLVFTRPRAFASSLDPLTLSKTLYKLLFDHDHSPVLLTENHLQSLVNHQKWFLPNGYVHYRLSTDQSGTGRVCLAGKFLQLKSK